MAERQRIEINAELLEQVRAIAHAQERPEAEVLEEAVLGYLSFLAARSHYAGVPMFPTREGDTADIGRPVETVYAGRFSDPDWYPDSLASVFAFVQRWQRERGSSLLRRGGHAARRRGAARHEERAGGPAVARAVLDPNVLVSALISPNGIPARLVDAAEGAATSS